MVNPDDANLISLQAVDTGKSFAANTVEKGGTFDVLAQVEIGKNLSEIAHEIRLRLGVNNLTRGAASVKAHTQEHQQSSKNEVVSVRVRVDQLPTGTDEGDLLQVFTTLEVEAGKRSDYSHGRSEPVIVVVSP